MCHRIQLYFVVHFFSSFLSPLPLPLQGLWSPGWWSWTLTIQLLLEMQAHITNA